ncbi:MAG TPA: hypothetical protein VJ812_12230 [Gemmatimonadaceae bacterium]|jgi:hypothetical protein|nr:hypothetical protein [Gemmatimonadaceae bacterium]
MIKRRSVTGSDGTIWQSVRQEVLEPATGADGAEPEQVRVTFQGGAREVGVLLPHNWLDQSTWPDWVIVGEIERETKK